MISRNYANPESGIRITGKIGSILKDYEMKEISNPQGLSGESKRGKRHIMNLTKTQKAVLIAAFQNPTYPEKGFCIDYKAVRRVGGNSPTIEALIGKDCLHQRQYGEHVWYLTAIGITERNKL